MGQSKIRVLQSCELLSAPRRSVERSSEICDGALAEAPLAIRPAVQIIIFSRIDPGRFFRASTSALRTGVASKVI
jgi:hypothetical protein